MLPMAYADRLAALHQDDLRQEAAHARLARQVSPPRARWPIVVRIEIRIGEPRRATADELARAS